MDIFSILMFLAVGLATGHVAYKVSEGELDFKIAFALGIAGALLGGLVAAGVGMEFYGLLGHMVVAAGCATLCFLVWLQIRA